MARAPQRQQGWAHSRWFAVVLALAILTTLWPFIQFAVWLLTAPLRLFS